MVRNNYNDTHEKILECGKKHFIEYGFEKSSLRDICKDACVTTGAFYRHFNDKNELFKAIVSPVANKIIDNFFKYEKISINGIRTKQNKKVAEVHVDGTIETAMFLFDNKEIYALLINGSFGSSYENFLEKLTEMEDNTRIKMQEIYSEEDDSQEYISNKGFHIINHSHFLALTEAVLHSEDKEELIDHAKLVSRFFSGGWKTVRGY
ncbi:TetR/AcrR family transcriptional regulator [Pseudoramibacter faecis]|uniref:TetR/AcrR family transcriptional regulator n=1 Tax=Pseudoramibacter faecis TaxID=3108534 RepID=UPI002E7A9FD0|nr:TetR/AcrR family transcriptional regulator [Pseudoramibacter sp. HA2172]